ncbi:hypothetical protein AB0M42_07915 [Streptomyces sp. NPDC051784]|uniref:hypothetical protein n=1 Tax=Streptomyces sp. NPDC051784 TaxID=3155805 RepID=UPI0034329CB3
MDSQLDPRTALMLLVGTFVVYVSLQHPQFSAALMVGTGVVTLLHLVMKDT